MVWGLRLGGGSWSGGCQVRWFMVWGVSGQMVHGLGDVRLNGSWSGDVRSDGSYSGFWAVPHTTYMVSNYLIIRDIYPRDNKKLLYLPHIYSIWGTAFKTLENEWLGRIVICFIFTDAQRTSVNIPPCYDGSF